ncbi:hypothetical protein IAQ61_002215 [Plenodomus lingam]|nr:hypothetical protein IAQ61_002215 [Plenodomus lingam]
MVANLTTLHDFRDFLLEPDYVATEIVKQVLSGQSGNLVLPPSNKWLSRLRSMPAWYRYYVAGLDPDVYAPKKKE